MSENLSVNKEKLIDDFRKLGIKVGDILNLKISLKSIGNVEGGAETVIDALLDVVGPDGTLVADSFVEPFPVFLKFLYKDRISSDGSLSYAGAITNAIMKKHNVFRATHPIQRFAAVGKNAKELTENFTISSEPYGFLKKMSYMGAKNIRVGGLDKVVGVGTTHVAICDLDLKQLRIGKGIYFTDDKGQKRLYKANWANGCPIGFNNLIERFRNDGKILAEGNVGNAECIITSMKETLEYEMDLLQKDPGAFLCDDPTCHFCSFTWKASKYSFFKACKESVRRMKLKGLLNLIAIRIFGKEYPRN